MASVVFGESIARMLSLVLDGTPGSITYLHIVMEFAPLAVLLLRPPAAAETTTARDAVAR